MKVQFLNKIFLGAALVSLTFLSSCGEEKKTETTAATENTSNSAENGDAPKVNPAHGLPGHRCDLPVGAPLDGQASVQPPTPTNNTSSNVSPIRVDKTPTVNPPHGEPGHDCSIPVGAPLE